MPLFRCIPVVFNQELMKKTKPELPKRAISHFLVPWYLEALRIILVLSLFVIWISSLCEYAANVPPKERSLVLFFLFAYQAFAFAIDVLFILVCDKDYHAIEDTREYIKVTRDYESFILMRPPCALAFAVVIFIFSSLYLVYMAVALVSIVIESVLCKLRQRHYFQQLSNSSKLLIADIQEIVGLDNCVSTPITTDFRDYDISEEELWEGVPIAARDATIKTSCGAMRIRDELHIFVSWTSYVKITNRINDDYATIDDLVRRNTDLRNEILGQNEKIAQMRARVYGPYSSTTDIKEYPFFGIGKAAAEGGSTNEKTAYR